MIQVCYYKGCGVIYGQKEPLSDKRKTHGLCPKHLKISLKEIKAEMEKLKGMTGGFTVLVVEDSTLFRQLFKETLHDRFPSAECCFSNYFDLTFPIRLMPSDYFEGSRWGTPLCLFQINSVEANRTCSALTC